MDIEIKSLSEEEREEAVKLHRIRDVLIGLSRLGSSFVDRYRTQEEKLKRVAIDHGAKPGDKVSFVDDSCGRTIAKIFIYLNKERSNND